MTAGQILWRMLTFSLFIPHGRGLSLLLHHMQNLNVFSHYPSMECWGHLVYGLSVLAQTLTLTLTFERE